MAGISHFILLGHALGSNLQQKQSNSKSKATRHIYLQIKTPFLEYFQLTFLVLLTQEEDVTEIVLDAIIA